MSKIFFPLFLLFFSQSVFSKILNAECKTLQQNSREIIKLIQRIEKQNTFIGFADGSIFELRATKNMLNITTITLLDLNNKASISDMEILRCNNHDKKSIAFYKDNTSPIGKYKYEAWILFDVADIDNEEVIVQADLRWGTFKPAVFKALIIE